MDLYRIPGHTLEGKHLPITIASGPVIIDNQQRILLHKASSTGKYQFIGGRLDDNLDPKTNAQQKPLQDLGLEVTIDTTLPPCLITGTIQRDGKDEIVVLIHYRATIPNEKQPTKGEYGWFTLEEIETMTKNNEVSSANILIASKHFLNLGSHANSEQT